MSMIRSYALCVMVLPLLIGVEYCFAEVPREDAKDSGPFNTCFLYHVLEVFGEVLLVFLVAIPKCGRRWKRNRNQSLHEVPVDSQARSKPKPDCHRLPTLLGSGKKPESVPSKKKKHSDGKGRHLEHVAERSPLSDALHACVLQADLAGAIDTVKRLSQFGSPSMEDYRAVIILCAKQDEPELAHMWLRTAEQKTGAPKTPVCYNAVMNAYAKRGDVARAVTVASGMKKAGVHLDTVSYNTVIDAAARAGDADTAERWMSQMQSDGLKASVITFSLVMRACAFAGRQASTEAWLEQADQHGIELNAISYSAIISAFVKAQDLQSANAWLNIMISRGVVASVHCFTSILRALVHQGDMQHATELVERMRATGVHLDVGVYTLLVQGALWAEDVHAAHSWAHEAVANGIRLPKNANSMLRLSHWVPRIAYDDLSSTANHTSNQDAREAVELVNSQLDADPVLESDSVGKRFYGTIKEFVPWRFGYIACAQTHRVYQRDVYLSSQKNPEGFVKGQRVSFKVYVDKATKIPRAYDLRPCQIK